MKITSAEAKQRLESQGITIRDWALANGFNPRTVYAVLNGECKAKRGIGYTIASRLGLKDRPSFTLPADGYLSVEQFAEVAEISVAQAKRILSGAARGKPWRGHKLRVRRAA